ncbi:unnamed protein product [Phytophthora fragariaefolia]|uniref:Unnamed protein product n=1 Tax=Phytophthora fragariaefolia TaxID=1490495 RepID=A0A9W7D9X0_9STRA|nr:unnamed protein product [Phytophthora fragariaefolia]
MEQFAHLPPSQQDALKKLMSLLGPEGVSHLASQGPDAVNARLNALRESSVGASPTENDGGHGVCKAHDYVDERAQAQATHGECEDLRRKGRGELVALARELGMVMGSALRKTEQQRVPLAISQLGGRAREWALTCRTSRAALSNTERVCKPGLLVVQATVKGFEKPWAILIDSGASGNYARRSTMEGSQLYAEALSARDRDIGTVRLTTGTRVMGPKVPVDLRVKFLDFDSVERCFGLGPGCEI